MATKKAIKKQKANEMKLRKSTSMLTRTPGVSARQAVKRQAESAGKAFKIKRDETRKLDEKVLGKKLTAWLDKKLKSPAKFAEKEKKRVAKAMGISTKGMGKYKEEDFNKGGMVRGYSTGGSVSGGQYASQPKKVKFKGVF